MASPEMMHAMVKGIRKKRPRKNMKKKTNPYSSMLMKPIKSY